MDAHGLQALQLWSEIDMLESIQPRPNKQLVHCQDRYAFFISAADFSQVSGQLLESADAEHKPHALEHLSEITKRKPEICVVLDANGHMSAWGLENVGCKKRTAATIFNITHIDDFKLPILHEAAVSETNIQFLAFCQNHDATLVLLVHHFDGRIQWLDIRPDKLFDQSPRSDRVQEKASWTGHDDRIRKIVRNTSGRALISRTATDESLVWRQTQQNTGTALVRASTLSCSEHIHRTCLLQEGDFVVNLHHAKITLWDARPGTAILVASCDYEVEGKPLCLILLPAPSRDSTTVYLATISSRMKGVVWAIRLPLDRARRPDTTTTPDIQQHCTFETELQDELSFVLPVDPAGSPLLLSGFLDSFAKDVAVSYTDRGVLRTWTATVDARRSTVEWLATCTVETGISQPSLASTSSIRKSALVDSSKNGLTLWDMSSGQLEYDMQYQAQEEIQDLDWSSTPDDQSILAVGFPHKVIILAQMRFDYLSTGPAWAPIRQIQIKELTPHPIGDSAWLGNGNLVIGTGNQLFVYDKDIATSDDMITDLEIPVHEHQAMDLFKIVSFLNGPLPLFHPQFLGQCILAGKSTLVQKIIVGLHKALRYFAPGDELQSFLSMPAEEFYQEQEVRCPSATQGRADYDRQISMFQGKGRTLRTLDSQTRMSPKTSQRTWLRRSMIILLSWQFPNYPARNKCIWQTSSNVSRPLRSSAALWMAMLCGTCFFSANICFERVRYPTVASTSLGEKSFGRTIAKAKISS